MANRVLLASTRAREADANFNAPETLYRYLFKDASTHALKEVYDSPIGGVSLGSAVELDANGYVPISGVWLDVGVYELTLQRRLGFDIFNAPIWEDIWTMPQILGATADSTNTQSINLVETVADLRLLSGDDLTGSAILKGYYGVGDGGEGVTYWDATSLLDDDGGSVFKPSSIGAFSAGRWIRQMPSGEIPVTLFGAITGQSNVVSNIANAVDYCKRTGKETGITLAFPAGEYSIGSPIDFDEFGTDLDGRVYEIDYHVCNGAKFLSANLGDAPRFFGLVRIDGQGYVNQFLSVRKVYGGEIFPEWWSADISTALNEMFTTITFDSKPRHGGNKLHLNKEYTLTLDNTYDFNLAMPAKFTGSGKLNGIANAKIPFSAVESFIGSSIFGGDLSAFEFGCEVSASWFNSTLQSYYTTVRSGYPILIDQNTTCGSNITVPYLKGTGGKLTTSSTVTITKCEGSNFLARSGSGVYSGVSNINHFADLSTENGIKCFIESNTSLADFQGVPTGANISVGSVKLSNMRHSGTITSTADIEGYNCVFSGAITAKSVQLMSCTTLGITINASAIFSVVLKNCITNGAITINSLTTDKIDKLIIENCYNRSAPTPLVVTNCLANSRQTGSIISVRNNVPECFADDAVPVGAWAQSYIDTELTTDTVGAPATYNYALSGKAFALLFPNIDIKTGVRLNTSSLSDLALSAGKDVITKTVGGATRVLTIVTNGVLVSSAKVRVTGNLY